MHSTTDRDGSEGNRITDYLTTRPDTGVTSARVSTCTYTQIHTLTPLAFFCVESFGLPSYFSQAIKQEETATPYLGIHRYWCRGAGLYRHWRWLRSVPSDAQILASRSSWTQCCIRCRQPIELDARGYAFFQCLYVLCLDLKWLQSCTDLARASTRLRRIADSRWVSHLLNKLHPFTIVCMSTLASKKTHFLIDCFTDRLLWEGVVRNVTLHRLD